MSDFIVDASIVAKWFVSEADSDSARSLIQRHHYLRAPDMLVPEVANVFWKRVRRQEMAAEEVEDVLDIFLQNHIDVTIRLLPSRLVTKHALRIAHAQRCSLYDSLYLAAAVQARCEFVTADNRFVRSITNPVLQRHILSLQKSAL